MERLSGKTALVTGAAQGIGFGIARRLSQEGARLLLVDRQDEALVQAGESIQQIGGTVSTEVVDLTKPDAAKKIAQSAKSKIDHVDILVNNAGIGGGGDITTVDDEKWSRFIDINLSAPFRLMRELLGGMADRGYGRIINIASVNGFVGTRGDAVYATSKAGLHALTKSVAADFGRFGITANTIAPGVIATPMLVEALKDQPQWFLRNAVENKPIAGMGQVEEVAGAVAYLASDEARFVTAQLLYVDGGLASARFAPDKSEYE